MSVFVPLGIAGAVIAMICTLVIVFALARGAAGLAGGATGLWIVGALLSMAASFASLWTPLFVSLGALGAALVVGALLRLLSVSVFKSAERAPREEKRQERTLEKTPEPQVLSPRIQTPRVLTPLAQSSRATTAVVRSTVTDGIRIVA
ncbi:hypothetical protein FM104_02690 [Microbacterium esteraromaticum]|uniref:Uncharacterized protein n=2 Tax=Microbacterium esteraromaticum TaxID=57043 RepID=A0A1R4IKX0_9MICO|nr:hypothetical protein FM104_02690 [Microbacterium esteraromaticum]